MLSDVEQLKQLITWARSQRIKSLKIGDAQFEFSDLAFIEDLEKPLLAPKDLAVPPSSPRLPDGNTELSEEDSDTFWSSR
jgi:hypothetical protein